MKEKKNVTQLYHAKNRASDVIGIRLGMFKKKFIECDMRLNYTMKRIYLEATVVITKSIHVYLFEKIRFVTFENRLSFTGLNN